MSNRALACRQVVQAHLERIDEVNPALTALVTAADPESCLAAPPPIAG
jgi:amidase